MAYFLGADGGGTKTKIVVTQSDGKIVGSIQGGASNFQQVGVNGLRQVCTEILTQLQQNYGIQTQEISYWALGLAGAGRKADQEAAQQAVESLGFAHKVTVESDAYIALLGAFAGRPGVIVISGTGSICFGLDENGQLHRAGGWGYLLGDEGSGYYLGHQSLLAALKDFDGRGEPTRLRAKVEEFLSLSTIDQVIRKMYIENALPKEEVAKLAPLVFECAAAGDSVAKKIVARTCIEIAAMIQAVGKKMNKFGREIEVAYIGSVFKQKDVLVPEIKRHLQPHFSEIKIHEPQLDPAIGAIILAMQKSGKAVTPAVIENLKNYELA